MESQSFMKTNFTKILNELSYRVLSGIPDLTNEQHLMKLWDILKEHNWNIDARVKLLKRLDEQGKERLCPICEAMCKHGETSKKTGCTPKSGQASQVDKKTSDKKAGNVRGNPNEGDNKVKNQMLEFGYNGMEDATGTKPAPGNPGSAFNEIVSGEGIRILDENPEMTEQELAKKMFDEFGETTLGQEQTQASGIDAKDYPPPINEDIEKAKGDGTLSNPDNPEALKKALKAKAVMSKCIIAARSAKQKHENSTRRTKNLQEQGKLGKKTETKTFYGADDSKQAQVDVIEESKKKGGKVLLPNGQEVDHDDAIAFIKAGGGGQNPSDTATFVTDEDGNVMLQFHSDKMSTADIQDNSTLAKEGDNYKESIDKQPLSEQEKKEAKAIVDKYDKLMADIEENFSYKKTAKGK
jgi:hypothetical protein